MHYDEGWNAYITGKHFNHLNSRDWKDGWFDCIEATAKYGPQKQI